MRDGDSRWWTSCIYNTDHLKRQKTVGWRINRIFVCILFTHKYNFHTFLHSFKLYKYSIRILIRFPLYKKKEWAFDTLLWTLIDSTWALDLRFRHLRDPSWIKCWFTWMCYLLSVWRTSKSFAVAFNVMTDSQCWNTSSTCTTFMFEDNPLELFSSLL